MEVPVDYAKPKGDRFTLALRKAPATDPSQAPRLARHQPRRARGSGVRVRPVRRRSSSHPRCGRHTTSSASTRGASAASSPVRCLSNSDMDLLFSADPTPDSAAERSTLLADVDGVDEALRGAWRGPGDAHEHHRGRPRHGRHAGAPRRPRSSTSSAAPTARSSGRSTPTRSRRRSAGWCSTRRCRRTRPTQQEMTYDIQGFESSIDAFIDWCVARPDCALGSDKAARARRSSTCSTGREARPDDEQAGPDDDRRGLGRLLDLHVPLLRLVVADAQQGPRPGVHRQGRHPPRQGHVGRRARASPATTRRAPTCRR